MRHERGARGRSRRSRDFDPVLLVRARPRCSERAAQPWLPGAPVRAQSAQPRLAGSLTSRSRPCWHWPGCLASRQPGASLVTRCAVFGRPRALSPRQIIATIAQIHLHPTWATRGLAEMLIAAARGRRSLGYCLTTRAVIWLRSRRGRIAFACTNAGAAACTTSRLLTTCAVEEEPG